MPTARHLAAHRTAGGPAAAALTALLAVWGAAVSAGGLPDVVTFSHISLEQGLSQSSISAIAQDQTGFLWFGTQDGLDRFDGTAFTVFRNDPGAPESISDNIVLALANGAGDVLWIGTADGGLNRFDPVTETFRRYRHDPSDPTSLGEDRVLAVAEDAAGALWIGTATAGLDRLGTDGAFTHRRHDSNDPASLPPGPVVAVLPTATGDVWVATPVALTRLDAGTGRFARYPPPGTVRGSLPGPPTTLFEDAAGTLWVGTAAGLVRYDPASDAFETIDLGTPSDTPGARAVTAIREDGAGRIWVGTFAGGLHLLEPGSGRRASWRYDPGDARSLSSDAVRAIHVDRSGLVWVGVDAGGINVYDPDTEVFGHLRPGPGETGRLSGRVVRAVAEAPDGALWIGVDGGGLDRVDRATGAVEVFRNDPDDPRSLANDSVFAVVVGRGGTVWAGTLGGGVNRLERDGGFTHIRHRSDDPASISSNAVRALLEDRRGRLWVGTVAGLDRIDGTGTVHHFRHDPADASTLSHDTIRCLHEARDGTIWVGTEAGLNALDPTTGRCIRYVHDPARPNSLSAGRIMSVWEDPDGIVWVGTVLGLNRVDPTTGAVRSFRRADGLPNDMVYGVLGDRDGALWISTNRGLARIVPGADGAVTPAGIRTFDRRDGLQSDEFNGAACFATPSGELLFGGVNGVSTFFPDRVPRRSYVPPVVLTGFRRLGEPVWFGTAVRYVDEIELRHDQNFFSFEFAALGFRDPGGIRCGYILEGFDTDWTDAGARRMAGYTNVRPGAYTFRVRAASRDGVWSGDLASIRVTVRPPWWLTGWAYLAYLIIGAVALAATATGHRTLVLARERKRARLVEAELRAQTAEAQSRALEAEHQRKSHELEAARRLQLSMLPRDLPRLAELDVAAYMDTATEVGGDYYDLKVGADGSVCVVVGDATGHGLQAGIMVSVMKGLFAAAAVRPDPGAFLSRSDEVFRELRVGRLHMALSVLHVDAGRAVLASAGMPPAYVYRADDGRVDEILLPAPPLGTSMKAAFPEQPLGLGPGDTVLLLSDGLPETLDRDGRPFDYPGVRAALARVGGRSPQEIVDELVAAGDSWRGDAPLRDDVTLVVLRRRDGRSGR